MIVSEQLNETRFSTPMFCVGDRSLLLLTLGTFSVSFAAMILPFCC